MTRPQILAVLFGVAAFGVWACESNSGTVQPAVDAGPLDCSAAVVNGKMLTGANGACLVMCTSGFGHCGASTDGPCNTNFSNDNANCGSCGAVCDPSKPCSNGACQDMNVLYTSDDTMVPGGLVVVQGTPYWMNRGILFKLAPGDVHASIVVSGTYCPLGLATDGTYLYWPNCSGYAPDAGAATFSGAIMRASITDGTVDTLAAGQNPLEGIELQPGAVIWLNAGPVDGGAQGGGISVASSTPPADAGPDADATAPVATILSPAYVPGLVELGAFGAKAFAVSNGVAFWIDGDGISSVSLDAGAATGSFDAGDLDADPDAEAAAPPPPPPPTPATVFVPPPTGAVALAGGASGVYWTNNLTPNPSSLFTASAGSPAAIVGTLSSTRAMIVDGTNVYIASIDAGNIQRVDTVAKTATIIATAQIAPINLAVDGKYVYWTTAGDAFHPGTVVRAPK